MKISLDTSRYLPEVSYFWQISKSDIFVFLDKQVLTCENKTSLKTENGKIILTVPIYYEGTNKLLNYKIRKNKWLLLHCNIIRNAYKSCKFHEYRDDIINFLQSKEWTDFTNLCIKTTKIICKLLNIKHVKFFRESEINLQELIENKQIISKDSFVSKNYKQMYSNFIDGLSIVDYLLNTGGKNKYKIDEYFSS